jgi:hypothetical protein
MMKNGNEATPKGLKSTTAPASISIRGTIYIIAERFTALRADSRENSCPAPATIITTPSRVIKIATKNAGLSIIHNPSARLPPAIITVTAGKIAPPAFCLKNGRNDAIRAKSEGRTNNAPTHMTMKGIASSLNIKINTPMAAIDKLRIRRCIITLLFR